MKRKLGQLIAKTAKFSAKIACNSTSLIGLYQPVTPKQLQKKTKPVNK